MTPFTVKRTPNRKRLRRSIDRTAKKIARDHYKNMYSISHLEHFGRRPIHFQALMREVKKYLGRNLSGKKIVQFGAAAGVFVRMLQRERAQSIALDISSQAEQYQQRLGVKNRNISDAQSPKLEDNSIDAVVSDRFLLSAYGSIDDKVVLNQAWRVLKPNGFLFIENSEGYIFTVKNVESSLRKHGFKIIKNEPINVRKTFPIRGKGKQEDTSNFLFIELSEFKIPPRRLILQKVTKN